MLENTAYEKKSLKVCHYKSIFTNSTLNPIFVDRKFPMPKDESYSVFWIDFFEPFKKVE